MTFRLKGLQEVGTDDRGGEHSELRWRLIVERRQARAQGEAKGGLSMWKISGQSAKIHDLHRFSVIAIAACCAVLVMSCALFQRSKPEPISRSPASAAESTLVETALIDEVELRTETTVYGSNDDIEVVLLNNLEESISLWPVTGCPLMTLEKFVNGQWQQTDACALLGLSSVGPRDEVRTSIPTSAVFSASAPASTPAAAGVFDKDLRSLATVTPLPAGIVAREVPQGILSPQPAREVPQGILTPEPTDPPEGATRILEPGKYRLAINVTTGSSAGIRAVFSNEFEIR
jgi:hypothetical protein